MTRRHAAAKGRVTMSSIPPQRWNPSESNPNRPDESQPNSSQPDPSQPPPRYALPHWSDPRNYGQTPSKPTPQDYWTNDSPGRDWRPDDRSSSGLSTGVVLAVVGVSLLLVVLLCGGVAIWGVKRAIEQATAALGPVPMPPADVESPRDKWNEVRSAFSGEGDVGADAETLREIERCLDDIVVAARASDDAAFRRKVNAPRLLQRIKSTGIITSLTRIEESMLENQLRDEVMVPWLAARYRIARVKMNKDGDEVLLFGTFWTEDDDAAEMRWWLRREGGRWKPYDWEVLYLAVPESTEWALAFEHTYSPGIDAYASCISDVNEADELTRQYDYEGAARLLEKAHRARVHKQLADNASVYVAYGWLRIGRYREAIECGRRVAKPDETPGAHLVLAESYYGQGQYKDSLAALEKYARQMGDSPVTCQQMAWTLSSLHRYDEAADHWRKLLHHDPGNEGALAGLAYSMGSEVAGELADHLRNVENPADVGRSLASTFFYSDNAAALASVVEMLQERAPGSPSLLHAQGLMLELKGEYEQAAELYRDAWKADPGSDTQAEYVYRYLDAMVAADKAVEGYENAPDPVDAFSYLCGSYEDGELWADRPAFERLVEAHRRNQPGDPWGDYYFATLLLEDEKHAEAEALLAAAIAKTRDEDVLDSLRYQHRRAMVNLGRAVEVFQNAPLGDEDFQQLAALCRSANRLEDLARLVKLERARNPFDDWIDYYDAYLCVARGDYEAAEPFFASGYRAASQEWITATYRNDWIRARVDSGRALSAYRDIQPAEETFATLASLLEQRHDWPALRELIELHKAREPQSTSLLTWQLEYCWQTGKYADVARLLDPWPEERLRDLATWELSDLGDKLVRSFLRLEQYDNARAAAEQLIERGGAATALAMVHAARGDADAVRRVIDENSLSSYQYGGLYYDDDCDSAMRSPAFRPLRDEFPPSLPYSERYGSISLLLSREVDWTAEQLLDALEPVLLDDVEISTVAPLATDGASQCFVVKSGGQSLVITPLARRYETSYVETTDPALSAACRDHVAVVSITWVPSGAAGEDGSNDGSNDGPNDGSNDGSNDEAASLAALAPAQRDAPPPAVRRAAAALADDACLAFYVSGGFSRLLPTDAGTNAALRGDSPDEELWKLGKPQWLYLEYKPDREGEATADVGRRRLHQLFEAFEQRRPDQEFSICVNLGQGAAIEPQWLRLQRVERPPRRGEPMVGTMTADSQLVDWPVRGEPLSVGIYDVVDWKYTDGDKIIRGREDHSD
jgi:tetratricopeptide (TPR) repeat protein